MAEDSSESYALDSCHIINEETTHESEDLYNLLVTFLIPGMNENCTWKDLDPCPPPTPTETPTTTETPTPTETCPLTLSANNFAQWGDRPARHTAGHSYNWCLGTPYDDPGLINLKDCDGETLLAANQSSNLYTTYVTTKYYVNGLANPSQGWEPPRRTNGDPLTEITGEDIAKLGTTESPTYSPDADVYGVHERFHVIYTFTSPSTNDKAYEARTIEVVGDAYESPTCGHKINHTAVSLPADVTAGQELVIGSGEGAVTVSGATMSGELWVSEGSGENLPLAISFMLNGSIIFVLTTHGSSFAWRFVDFKP